MNYVLTLSLALTCTPLVLLAQTPEELDAYRESQAVIKRHYLPLEGTLADDMAFAFPLPSGDTLRWNDPSLQDQVLVLKFSGTWCPDCVNLSRGFEAVFGDQLEEMPFTLVELDYERETDFEVIAQRIRQYQERTSDRYPMVYAGKADRGFIVEQFPVMKEFHAYPTLVFVDPEGQLVAQYWGFDKIKAKEDALVFMEEFRAMVEDIAAGTYEHP